MFSEFKKQVIYKEGILLIIVLLTCFLSYFQITEHEFVKWDDDTQITENTYVKNLNWQSLDHNLKNERYTFLTLTTYSVMYNVWGNNPVPFHGLSIFLHLLNVILVFLLTKQFSKNIYTIGLVTLLFALHPMRVESVAWISEIKDLLFTFFSLIAMHFYIKYLKNNFKFFFFILAAIMAVLASFSKIQGLLVPFSFFLIDYFYSRKFTIGLMLEKIILTLFIIVIFSKKVLLAVVLILIFKYFFNKIKISFKFNKLLKLTLIIISGFTLIFFLIYYFYYSGGASLWSKDIEIRNSFSFAERFLLAGFALWFYIKNFFLPVSLSAVHPYPQRLIDGSFPQEYYFTLIVLLFVIVLSVFLVIRRKKIPDLIFFGWFFFLVNISFVLHFIPIEGRLVAADRYSYLAYFGLFISLASIGENYLFKKQKYQNIILLFFILLLIVLSFSTYNRCKAWKNTKILFTDVLQKNPNISFAHLNLAATYLGSQQTDSAIICFNKSIQLDSLDPTAYFNRAFAFIKKNNDTDALKDFNTVIRLSKNKRYYALANTNIGEIYRKRGEDSLAIYYYNEAIKNDSNLSISFNNRGIFFLNKNLLITARKDFETAVNLNLDYAEAINNLGWVLTLQGELEPALKYFNRSLELNPNYSFAYNNRGYLKYLKRDPKGSIMDINKAITLDPLFNQAYINRGRTYASMKDFNNAINDFTVVLKTEPKNMIAITNRAYARFYNNDLKNAENDFKLNLTYYPNDAISWQNIALFHMQIKNYKNAIVEFEKSIQLNKTLINSFINLGFIYIELKEFKKADDILNSSIKLNPNNSESLFLLGELNRKIGKEEVACKYYNSASNVGNSQAKKALLLYCKNYNLPIYK